MTKMKFKADLDAQVNKMRDDAMTALDIKVEVLAESAVAFKKARDEAFAAAEKPAKEGDAPIVLDQNTCDALAAKVLSTTKGLNPLYVFEKRVKQATVDFTKTDGEEKDVAAFKRAFHLAQAECVNAYKAEGNSTAVDYLKAAGLALLGALVAIIASPLLAFSADKRTDLVNTFFSGVETDRSKLAQTEMKADAAGDLLEEVAAPANN